MLYFLLAFTLSFSLCACAQESNYAPISASSSSIESQEIPSSNHSQSVQSAKSNHVPDYKNVIYDVDFLYDIESETITALEHPCTEQGSVVTLTYTTPAYALNEILGTNLTLEKTVTVYLPYGYDDNQQYDVLYLLHGTGGNNEYWLQGKKTGATTRNVLDNMIQQGLCKPLIVVTPNYYGNVKGSNYKLTDEQCVTYGTSIGDSYLLCANDIWTDFFQYELRNEIIPLVESQYSTYASRDISSESLISSRSHRAFAGLSRGAMTVSRAGLISSTDYFSYFGSFSGVWTEDEDFVTALNSSDYPVYFWYNGNGTEDFSAENHINFHNMVMERLSDRFADGVNYALVVKDGASHSYENWITDLYNMLLISFNKM